MKGGGRWTGDRGRRLRFGLIPLFTGVLVAGCAEPDAGRAPRGITLTSPAFLVGGAIPARFTCEGANLSPPLAWSGVPEGTQSLVLVMDDPDAGQPDPWVHWVLYNIPPDATGLAEGAIPPDTEQGKNDWKDDHYGGPCPPSGRHRYFFRLYALDTVLPKGAPMPRARLERAMQGEVLARGELMGTYQKSRGR